jgi:D-3-phosphoglycerate dehydrogenase / 2-oxoglutarate reductase
VDLGTAETLDKVVTIARCRTAASTDESLVRTNKIAAQSVIDVLQGRSPWSECIAADGR